MTLALVELAEHPDAIAAGRTVAVSPVGSGWGFGGEAPAPVHTAKELLFRNVLTGQGASARRGRCGPLDGTCVGHGPASPAPLFAGAERWCCDLDAEGRPIPAPVELVARRRTRRGRVCMTRETAAMRAPKRWRYYLGRGRTMSWRGYARAIADQLDAMGWGQLARRLRVCGSTAEVQTCGACGDPHAAVRVIAGCSLRVCPWCARRESRERAILVQGAVDRVPEYVRLDAPEHRAELVARLAPLDARRAELVARRAELVARPSTARVRDQLAACDRRLAAITARRSPIVRAQHAARALDSARDGRGWSWRLITLSPQWSPDVAASYSVEGLRSRVADVRERWRRVWHAGAGVEGLAAAYLRIEVSERGHVHAHVLHFGPWQSDEWVARIAGCFADVRQLDADGVREAVKYAVKAPSPLRGAWVGGGPGRVMHPTLAARYLVATRSRRLAEPYGVMRRALAASETCGPVERDEAPTLAACASCGSCELVAARIERTVDVAVQLGPRWSWRPRGDAPAHDSFAASMASAMKGTGPRTNLPARVSIMRPKPSV